MISSTTTTWPQTDDVIRLTSLSIHHCAGVDMSDTLALARDSTSVTFSCELTFIAPGTRAASSWPSVVHGHLKGEQAESRAID